MDTIIKSLKDNWKRYLISIGITFIAGFLSVFLASVDNITLESLENGTLAGVVFVAVRTGVKFALECLLSILIKK